jgi:hypothetical protein
MGYNPTCGDCEMNPARREHVYAGERGTKFRTFRDEHGDFSMASVGDEVTKL